MSAPRAKTTALARQILEIARRDGLAAGAHLPEVKLAERLGVSRSPVRAAHHRGSQLQRATRAWLADLHMLRRSWR